MRLSKMVLLILWIAGALQACAVPDQPAQPRVITVVVTAPPSATEVPTGADASPTPVPTATLPATDTPAPSPTARAQALPTATKIPAPVLPQVSNLPAQGPQGGDIDFGVVMSPIYLMRIKAKKQGATTDGDGIDHVTFIVKNKSGSKLYSATEKVAKFCIFKGGEPDCNPWPVANGRYTWGVGGSPVESGQYPVTIRVALKTDPSSESEWNFPINIKLPY